MVADKEADDMQRSPFEHLEREKQRSGWLDALRKAEEGHPGSLIARLRSKAPLDEYVREMIADLLDRRPLGNKRGRPKTPAYLVTPARRNLIENAFMVRGYMDQGRTLSEALLYFDAEVNQKLNLRLGQSIDLDKLENFMKGRGGSARRTKKKRVHP